MLQENGPSYCPWSLADVARKLLLHLCCASPGSVEGSRADWDSNVWALEAVLKDFPNAGQLTSSSMRRKRKLKWVVIGTFLTFAQFLYVTLQTVSSQLYFPPTSAKSIENGPGRSWVPRVRKMQVPVKRWLVQVFLFLGVSLSEWSVSEP